MKNLCTISVTYSDIIVNNKPAFALISVELGGIEITIWEGRKKLNVQKGGYRTYHVSKPLFGNLLKDALRTIKNYKGRPLHIASIIAKNIPLEEIKDTELMKFVFKKLGKKQIQDLNRDN